MSLANFSTTVPVHRTADEIMSILRRNGARRIMADYDDRGDITAIVWAVEHPDYGILPFRLPVRPEKTLQVMRNDHVAFRYLNMDHAKRVAWRITKDWIRAQMALLQTEMVRMEELFLPYMLTGAKRTMFEELQDLNFRPRLEPGKPQDRNNEVVIDEQASKA